MWEKLQNVDRRIIYALMVIVVIVPLFSPIGLPISINPDLTQRFFDFIEKLPAGSIVWMGPDYSPGASAELNPQVAAVFRHLLMKGHKVIFFAMWEQGASLSRNVAEPIAKEMGKKYGEDWVHLGYKPGSAIALRAMVNDVWQASAGVDINGTKLGDLPLMAKVKKLDNSVALCIDFSSGSPGDGDYRQYVTDPQNIPLMSGQVAVQVPTRLPYIRSGQQKGIIPGLRGAAEYEKLIKKPGAATQLMDAQSLGHVLIIFFILLGNIGFVATRKK
ncbi:MAG: hypothetical protein Q8P50_09775 [Bacillota bacterium]|nr:hypothetical protein [Bacillota bacterium]